MSAVWTYCYVVSGIQYYIVDFEEETAQFPMYPYISSST